MKLIYGLFFLSLSIISSANAITIHGSDNRTILTAHEIPNYAKAIAGIYTHDPDDHNGNALTLNKDGTYSIKTVKFQSKFDDKLCTTHPFFNQDVGASCTAFLIEPNKVMTAGHCLQDEFPLVKDLEFPKNFPKKIIFQARKKGKSQNNIYSMKKVLQARKSHFFGDYAIIELDRDVKEIEPLKLNLEFFDNNNTSLSTIGHQEGLLNLVKVDQGSYAKDEGLNSQARFKSNLDINSGSSGSPVFDDSTGEVIGIISSTSHETEDLKDYLYNIDKECVEDKVYKDIQQTTRVQRIDDIYRVDINREFQELVLLGRLQGTEYNPTSTDTLYRTGLIDINGKFGIAPNQHSTLYYAIFRYLMYKEIDSINYLLSIGVAIDEESMLLAEGFKAQGDSTLSQLFANYKTP